MQIQHTFQANDPIIWDSGFGYEVGYYIGEGKIENTILVELKTGVVQDVCSYPKIEILPYSIHCVKYLSAKYQYHHIKTL